MRAFVSVRLFQCDDGRLAKTVENRLNGIALPGWLSLYLGATGFVRAVAAWLEDGFGDPVLTMIDSGARAGVARRQARVGVRQRIAREGPEVPDRVVSGAKMGMAGGHLVIVASRPKPGWDPGTIVITQYGAYRLGKVEERIVAGRLRTLYPLTAHTDQEVFRRVVDYALPVMHDQSGEAGRGTQRG